MGLLIGYDKAGWANDFQLEDGSTVLKVKLLVVEP